MEQVELTTGNLSLRPWRPSDAPAVFLACQDPLIQHWTTVPVPYLPEHAEEFVGPLCRGAWESGTAAPLGIFETNTGALLGSHGLVSLDRETGIAEAGIWLAPSARGRGVAERSTRAVAGWALEVLGVELLIWRVALGNHASRLVAERVGFAFGSVERGLATGRPTPSHDDRIQLIDGWRGTLRRGEITRSAPDRFRPGGIGARRARSFAADQPTLTADGAGQPGKITLRPLTVADLPGVAAAGADPESVRWTSLPAPYTRSHARWFIHDHAPAQWASGTGAVFAVVDPQGRFAGTVSLRISNDDRDSASVGYLIAPAARNRGLATAAVRTICSWGFAALGLYRITWQAYVGNDASRRVAEKAGFQVEGIHRGGCVQRGERRDAWIATLLASESTEVNRHL